jgi:hypothetical protein
VAKSTYALRAVAPAWAVAQGDATYATVHRTASRGDRWRVRRRQGLGVEVVCGAKHPNPPPTKAERHLHM